MPKLNISTLNMFKEYAKEEFLKLPKSCKLKGMNRVLSEGELFALAYYRASVRILASRKALKDEWLEEEGSDLELPDSDPDADV